MNSCKGCAKLVQVVNCDVKYCTEKEGILYYVDDDYYKNNDCDEKCNTFELRGVDWK